MARKYQGEIVRDGRLLYKTSSSHSIRGNPGIPSVPGIPGILGSKGAIGLPGGYRDLDLDE